MQRAPRRDGLPGARCMKRSVYAIGDVHGCATSLERLLARLRIREDTLVIFLGDYVDRGKDSRRVIDVVLDLQRRCEVVTLMGNHEAMWLDFLDRPESMGAGLFILNGGGATLAQYAQRNGSFEIPQAHVDFLRGLRLTYETDTHFFVHAGVPLDKPLQAIDPKADRQTLLWSRGPFLQTEQRWDKVVVHGHTPTPVPEKRPNRINIDTGCVFGGHLTAYDLTHDRFVSVRQTPLPDAVPESLVEIAEGRRRAVRFPGRMPVRASRPGRPPMEFVTLNYNPVGLLLQEFFPAGGLALREGDVVRGHIGDDPLTAVAFQGVVVRTQSWKGMTLYGVRIERLEAMDEPGHRPEGAPGAKRAFQTPL